MDKVLSSDLPPAYSTLSMSHQELTIAADIEHGTGPLIGKSFENKNARVMFTQKVLSIFLLQTVAVGIVLGIFAYYRIVIEYDLIGVAAVVYLVSLFIMAFIDQVKNRNIYNYIILVYYPITVVFVVVMLATLPDVYWQVRLRITFVCAWISYTLAGVAVLFYSIFALDSKHEFKLMDNVVITIFVFAVSFFGISIPLYMGDSEIYPISALCVTVFLYLYLMYVLYDIDAMTSGNYRSALTPADYVTGAVNLQIDFLFITRDFIKKHCCCSSVE